MGGSLVVHSWFVHDSLVVRLWFLLGSRVFPLVRCGSLLVHCWFAVSSCVVRATGSPTLTTAARAAWTVFDWMLNLCLFEGGSFVILGLFLGVSRVVRKCYCWLAIVCC